MEYKKTSDLPTPKVSNTRANCMPILTRPYYYMKPSINELKSLFDDEGRCVVEKFTVGHNQYGSVTFCRPVDVAGLNLDQISK